MGQPPCSVLGYHPQRVKSIHVQSVSCARRVTRCRSPVPALPVKIGKTRRSTGPNRAVMTRSKREYGAGWEPILRSVMLQAARVPPSDPAEAIADPEPRATRRDKKRGDASCRAGLSLRRSERLKLKAIETNETRWTAQPQQPIFRLRERADFRWGSIARRPRSVIQLREREVSIQGVDDGWASGEHQYEAGDLERSPSHNADCPRQRGRRTRPTPRVVDKRFEMITPSFLRLLTL
jgi:hypothetical protein